MMAPKVKFNWLSSDGEVYAYLSWPASGECNIHEFVAENGLEGEGRNALEELRPLYKTLRAVHRNGRNRMLEFWLDMARERLIDVVLDSSGDPISP